MACLQRHANMIAIKATWRACVSVYYAGSGEWVFGIFIADSQMRVSYQRL